MGIVCLRFQDQPPSDVHTSNFVRTPIEGDTPTVKGAVHVISHDDESDEKTHTSARMLQEKLQQPELL
jgi:hypothetical protein